MTAKPLPPRLATTTKNVFTIFSILAILGLAACNDPTTSDAGTTTGGEDTTLKTDISSVMAWPLMASMAITSPIPTPGFLPATAAHPMHHSTSNRDTPYVQ